MTESDWKVFRRLHSIALERFCQRVLSEVARLATDTQKDSHARYLAVYRLIRQRDRELADAFNDPRRSGALRQLACIQSHDLLTDDEFTRFSAETREAIQFFLAEFRHKAID